jgi:hypothetical protein
MGNRSRRLVCVAALIAFALATPGSAAAQPSGGADIDQARELFVQALEQRDQGDSLGALAKFKVAYAIAPNPVTAVELGRTYGMVGLLVEARDTLLSIERFPVGPQETARAQQARVEAGALAPQIAARIAQLSIAVAGRPIDAVTVALDGAVLSPAALARPQPVNPGVHHVVVLASAGVRAETEVDLKEGESRGVALTLPSAAAPRSEATTLVAPAVAGVQQDAVVTQPATGAVGPVSFAALGVGAAGFLGGAIIGGLALSKLSTLEGICHNLSCNVPLATQDLQSARTLAYASITSFAVAGVGLAVGVLALLPNGPSGGSAGAPKRAAGAALFTWIGPGTIGLRGLF